MYHCISALCVIIVLCFVISKTYCAAVAGNSLQLEECQGPRGRTYHVFHDEEVNWQRANDLCNAKDMRLASFSTEGDYNRLVSMLKKVPRNLKPCSGLGVDFWVGASDLGERGNYVSPWDGQPLKYTRWAQGDFRKLHETKRCVEVNVRSDYHMNNYECDFKQYFVCEQVTFCAAGRKRRRRRRRNRRRERC